MLCSRHPDHHHYHKPNIVLSQKWLINARFIAHCCRFFLLLHSTPKKCFIYIGPTSPNEKDSFLDDTTNIIIIFNNPILKTTATSVLIQHSVISFLFSNNHQQTLHKTYNVYIYKHTLYFLSISKHKQINPHSN